MFCSLLTRFTIPCACHTKRHLNVQRWSEHVFFLTILTWKCASRHNGVHFSNMSTSKSAQNLVCFVHFDLEMCFAPQRRALFEHLNFQKWSENGVFCTFWLGHVLRATTVHFFDISTSKRAPKLVCFVHFDLDMCFAPQRRALFHHLNFQKCSEHGVSCTFWLGNVLRAATACTFSTSQLPKVVREWCVLYILTWKCASRHNGVQFFISHLATVFRDFATFSRTCIFFLLLFLFSDLLSSALLVSDSSHLCFSIVVGSLTSKLPSIMTAPIYPWDFFFGDV